MLGPATDQHGFTAGRSTSIPGDPHKLMNKGHSMDVLYLDCAKVFDKAPHGRPKEK